ncbi:MAG: TonB C-terminal domain-containing protein [Acidobacteria bacterium]|nr:TonB C-terminal domain-containing protein [Acidobacteriota bacterium]
MAYASNQLASPSLKMPFLFSLAFHMLLFGSLALSTLRSHRGEVWGGPGGGSMTVGLVGSLAGVPLPRPEAITPSRVVDETKGLYTSEPRPKEPETPAKQIPEFARNKPQRYFTRPSRVLENPTPPPPNAVPYGQGGSPSLPYTQFTMAGGTQGGMGFSGPGGDFGGRFPWYVEAVRNRVSSNWLQSTVDPAVRWAPRAIVVFQILRDGHIVNAQLTRSSGNASVDNSALRAILSSSPCPSLPAEYAGSHVTVEFYFEFRR